MILRFLELEMKENIIEIKNLNKSYGDVKAVKDLSFCVKQNSPWFYTHFPNRHHLQ